VIGAYHATFQQRKCGFDGVRVNFAFYVLVLAGCPTSTVKNMRALIQAHEGAPFLAFFARSGLPYGCKACPTVVMKIIVRGLCSGNSHESRQPGKKHSERNCNQNNDHEKQEGSQNTPTERLPSI
jgi:hypothetical protein